MPDDVPLWFDVLARTALAVVNFLSGSYESALLGASRSRISRALETRRLPASSFLMKAASDDPSILMRVDLLYVFSTALFISYGIWTLIRADGAMFVDDYIWGTVACLAALFLVRMAANPVGDYFAERMVINVALPMSFLTAPFYPLAWLALAAERVFTRAVGVEEEDEEDEREAEVIDAVSDGQLDGVVEDGQKEMIEGIFEFKDSDVADIIVPRTEMTTVDAEAGLSDAIALAMDKGYSRMPAFKGNRDNIVGIFYVRDALRHWDKPEAERPALVDMLRPPLFVPETKLIPELLAEMRRGQSHMAVVLDEYGGTAGLVTIEDVLEEIVGDIQDEFDAKSVDSDGRVKKVDDYTLVADGNAHVGEINKMLGDDIIPEDDDYETAAGFVLDNLGHIPKIGESFVFEEKLSVRVLQADERRVKRVRLQMQERVEA
ncbi:MAG: hemolysin family protein [Planctomycetaceae bacterium]|nr:hemolysin family protein [Planctomycetaceae bacterium]